MKFDTRIGVAIGSASLLCVVSLAALLSRRDSPHRKKPSADQQRGHPASIAGPAKGETEPKSTSGANPPAVSKSGGGKRPPLAFFKLLGLDPGIEFDSLDEQEKKRIIEKALSLLSSLKPIEVALVIKSLWDLRVRHPELSGKLIPLCSVEERLLFMPALLNVIALQADNSAKTFLTSLVDDRSPGAIDHSFLAEALTILAEQRGITSGDILSSALLARLADPTERYVGEIARPLILSGDDRIVTELESRFLSPTEKWPAHKSVQFGAALLTYNESFVSESAAKFPTLESGAQLRLLYSLHRTTGRLASELEKQLGNHPDEVYKMLYSGLSSTSRDVRLEACRVLASQPSFRSSHLDSTLQQLSGSDVDDAVRLAAAHALRSK